MIRKLILTAVLATGAVAGVTATANTADAAPPIGHDHDHDRDRGRFQVLVRHRGHWDVHGTYRDRDDAERAARRLERQGLDTRIERVRGW